MAGRLRPFLAAACAAFWIVVVTGGAIVPPRGASAETGLPLPRFVSVRSGEVNMRTGPGVRYPVDWVLVRRSMPVEILAEFEVWRKIRDHEGAVGWVHQSMLSGERTVLVTAEPRLLRREASTESRAIARLEPGVIARLLGCENSWCRVQVAGLRGWLRASEIWGLYTAEASG